MALTKMTLAAQPIDLRRFNEGMACAAQLVEPQIIHQDENNVGPRLGGGSHRAQTRNKQQGEPALSTTALGQGHLQRMQSVK
jgi:hypothetical protein